MKHINPLANLLLTTLVISGTAYASPASDAEIEALKAQVRLLSERLEALEKQKAQPVAVAQPVPVQPASMAPAVQQAATGAVKPVAGQGEPVVGGVMPGSFKLPGTNTSVKIGGYAKLDGIYDANQSYGAQYANFANIPLDNAAVEQHDGQFNAHARQSRINLETRTPTAMGELKTFFEVDFFGSARGNANTTNGEGVQLRHAYGQVGGLLAGQTWSNFMDVDAYPESLDYIGPVGLTFVRQAQARYTGTLSDRLSYSVALESPQTDFSVTSTRVSLSDTPDVTGKLVYKDDFGHLALRGLARKLDAGSTATGVEDEAYGWAMGVSGKVKTFGKDAVMFQGVYGDGVGHYLLEVALSGNGNTYVGNSLRPQVAYGGYLGYQHYWTDTLRSNLLVGYTGIDNDVTRTGAAVNKEIMSGHVNLIWNPVPAYRVGVEYMHGIRTLENDLDGDLDRFQASFMYMF